MPIAKVDVPAMAEREGFEPPEGCPSTVFKTAAFVHSATSPNLNQQLSVPFLHLATFSKPNVLFQPKLLHDVAN